MAQFDDRNMMDDVQEDRENASRPLDNIKDNIQQKATNKLKDKIKSQGRNNGSRFSGSKSSPVPNSTAGRAPSASGGASKAASGAGKAAANAGKAAGQAGKAAGGAAKAGAAVIKAAGEAIIATMPYSLIVLAVIIVIALIVWIFYCASNGTLFNIVTKIHDGAINDVRELGKKFLPHASEEEIASTKENDWRFKYNTLSAEQQYDYICNGNTALSDSDETHEGLVQYIEKGYLNAKIAYSNSLGNIQIYSDKIKELEDSGKTITSIEAYRLHSSAPTDQQLYNRSYKPYTNVDIAKHLSDSGLIEKDSIDPGEEYTTDMRLEGKTAPFRVVYFDGEGSGTLLDSTKQDNWFSFYNKSIAYQCAMHGNIYSEVGGDDAFDASDMDSTLTAYVADKILKGKDEETGEEYDTSTYREWSRPVNERLNTDVNPDGDGVFDNTIDNFVNYVNGENGTDYENVGLRDYYYYFKTAVAYATTVEQKEENGNNVQNENAYLASVAAYAKKVRDGTMIYRNPYINEINYFDYIVLYGSTGLKSEEAESEGDPENEKVLFDVNSLAKEGAMAEDANSTDPKQNTIKERYLLNLDLTYLANYELLCPELNPDGKFAFAKNSQMMNTVNYLISGMDIATCNISPAWGYLDFLSKTIGNEDVFNASLRFSDQFKKGYISDNGQFGWFVKFVVEPDVVEEAGKRKPEQYPRLAYLLSTELELRHDVPVWDANASLAEEDNGGPVHYRKVEDTTFPTGVENPDFCESYVWIEANDGGPEDYSEASNTPPNEEGEDGAGEPIHESNLFGVLDMAGAEAVAMKGAFLGYDMYGIPCYQYYIKITDPIDTDRLLWSMLVSDAAKTMTYNSVWESATSAYQGSYYEAYQCFEPLSASTVQGKVTWLDNVAAAVSNFWTALTTGGENSSSQDNTLSLAKSADADQVRRYLYGLTPEEADDGIHVITDASGKPISGNNDEIFTVKDYFMVLYEYGNSNEFDKKLLYSDLLIDKNRDGVTDYNDYKGILNETYFSYTPRFLYQCDYLSGGFVGIDSLKTCHNLCHDSYGVTEDEWANLINEQGNLVRCLYHQYNEDGIENCAECLRLNGGLEAPAAELGGISAYRWAQDLPPTCPDCDMNAGGAGGGTASYVQKAWSGRPKIEYVRNSQPEFCDIISISEEEYIKYIDNDAKPLSTSSEDIGYGLMELEGNKKVDLDTNYNRQGYGYNPGSSSEGEQTISANPQGGSQSSGGITNPDGTTVDLGDKPEYNYYFSEYEWYAELGSDEKWIKLKDSGEGEQGDGDGISEKISLIGFVNEETEEEIHPVTNSYDEWDSLSQATSSELVTHTSVKSLSDIFESKQRIAADYNRQKWVDYTKKFPDHDDTETVRDYRAVSLLSALYHRKYSYDNLLSYDTYKSGYWDEGNGHEPAPGISREVAEYDDKGNITQFYNDGSGSGSGRGDAFDDAFHNDDNGYEVDEHGNLIKEGNSFKKSDKQNTSFYGYNAEASSAEAEIENTGDTKIEQSAPLFKEDRDYDILTNDILVDIEINGFSYRITGNDIVNMMISPETEYPFVSTNGGPTINACLKDILDPDNEMSSLFGDDNRDTLASLAARSLPYVSYGYGVERDIGTSRLSTDDKVSDLTLIDYNMSQLMKDKDYDIKYLKKFWAKVKKDALFNGFKYKKIPMNKTYDEAKGR